MNPVDTTIKPTENISLLMDEDNNCTAVDNTTGELCGESKSLKIIDEFVKLYESRIQNVDEELEDEFEKVCVKLEISREWIKNLREQNIMLVQTVEDLEQAACSKVKLLEQKLNQSSMIVSENLPSFNDTGKTIHVLSSRVNDLEKDEKYMRQRIKFLESDIRGLLELIRRAAQENRWNLDGIKFFEIPPDDIPIPIDCTCDQEGKNNKEMMSLKSQIEHLRENEKRMIVHQRELENKLVDLNKELEAKEDTIKKYATELQNFSHGFKKHVKFGEQNASNSFTNDQQSSDIMLTADFVERTFTKKDLETKTLQQRLYDAESNLSRVTRDMNINVNNLKVKLNEKCKIIQEIERQMANTKKELLEKQDALTAELTEKNETIISLQKQMTILQEQCHCASVQINFKEDIIKEMRKKMKKVFKCLYFDLSSCNHDHYNRLDIDIQKMESFLKLCEKPSELNALYTSAKCKNYISLLQSCITNCKKVTESLPIIEVNNLTTKTINFSQDSEYDKLNMYKNFRDIDEEILKCTKKLPSLNRNC